MKEYKTNLPEITIKLKKGEVLNCQVKTSTDAVELLRKIWDMDTLPIYESVICVFFNNRNNTIGWFKVSQGGLSNSIVDNRLILSTALTCLASGIILAHNHPSGYTAPSDADYRITQKLYESSNIMDIKLLDHIILTEDSYYSFLDEGKLQ